MPPPSASDNNFLRRAERGGFIETALPVGSARLEIVSTFVICLLDVSFLRVVYYISAKYAMVKRWRKQSACVRARGWPEIEMSKRCGDGFGAMSRKPLFYRGFVKVGRDRESILEVESPAREAEIRPDTPSKKVSTRHSSRAPTAASEGGDGPGEAVTQANVKWKMENGKLRSRRRNMRHQAQILFLLLSVISTR